MSKDKLALHRYRIIPLIVVGMIILTAFDALALLIWSFVSFKLKIDVSSAVFMPAFIYLIGVFLSCLLMTRLIRGGTMFPSLILSAIAAVISLFWVDPALLSFGGVLLRILLTVLSGLVAFTIGKLLVLRRGSGATQKGGGGEQREQRGGMKDRSVERAEVSPAVNKAEQKTVGGKQPPRRFVPKKAEPPTKPVRGHMSDPDNK